MMVIIITPELHLVSIKEEDTVVKAVFKGAPVKGSKVIEDE
jgi:hypothetical protein